MDGVGALGELALGESPVGARLPLHATGAVKARAKAAANGTMPGLSARASATLRARANMAPIINVLASSLAALAGNNGATVNAALKARSIAGFTAGTSVLTPILIGAASLIKLSGAVARYTGTAALRAVGLSAFAAPPALTGALPLMTAGGPIMLFGLTRLGPNIAGLFAATKVAVSAAADLTTTGLSLFVAHTLISIRAKLGLTPSLPLQATTTGSLRSQGKAPSGTLPLATAGTAALTSRAGPHGVVALASVARAAVTGRIGVIGSVALGAATSVAVTTRATAVAFMFLLARGLAAARSMTPATGIVALLGKSVGGLRGNASAPSGTVGLGAFGLAASRGRSVATGIVSLATASTAALRQGRANIAGIVAVAGASVAALSSRVRAIGVTALTTVSTTALRASAAAPLGRLVLAAAGAAITSASAAAYQGALTLATKTVAAVRGRSSPSGAAPLTGAAKLTLRGNAVMAPIAVMVARSLVALSARATPSGIVGLAASGAVAARSIVAGSFGAAMATIGRSAATGKSAATLVGTFHARGLFAGLSRTSPQGIVSIAARALAALFSPLEPRPLSTNPRFITGAPPRNFLTAPRGDNPSMPQGRDFSPIDAGELITGTFDFGQWLPAGLSIYQVVSVTCAVYSGTDADAATRTFGSPEIGPSVLTGIANCAVLQQWGNMVAGVTYRLIAEVITTDNQTWIMWAHQACVAPD